MFNWIYFLILIQLTILFGAANINPNLPIVKDYSNMNIKQLINELILIVKENDPETIQSLIQTYRSML